MLVMTAPPKSCHQVYLCSLNGRKLFWCLLFFTLPKLSSAIPLYFLHFFLCFRLNLILMFGQSLSHKKQTMKLKLCNKNRDKNTDPITLEILLQTITTTMIKSPCDISQKTVAKRHKAICCDLCDKWIHIACNNLDKK